MNTMILNKKRAAIFVFILLFILSSVIIVSNRAGKAYAADTTNQVAKGTMIVSGQGKVTAAPDLAYINLGVTTEHENAKAAQQENTKLMNEVVNRMKGAGVSAQDIKTTNYNIYPQYSYNQKTGESKIKGYSVSNSVLVTVRDLSKLGALIDLASEGGSNVISGISFGLSDYEKYYNLALKSAVEIAKKRAETMGAGLGINLKTPISISESGTSAPVINYREISYAKKEMASATPIEPGSMDITATVSVTYEY